MEQKYSYYRFFHDLYCGQGQKYAFRAEDREEFHAWKKAFRKELSDKLGLERLAAIQQKSGLKERFLNGTYLAESIPEDGYTRVKYIMETLPEVFMPFYVLVPDKGAKNVRRSSPYLPMGPIRILWQAFYPVRRCKGNWNRRLGRLMESRL